MLCSSANAGLGVMDFIYKPKFVSGVFIVKEVAGAPSLRVRFKNFRGVKIIDREGNQDLVQVTFSGYINTFKPATKSFLEHLATEIDTIDNGLREQGFTDRQAFCSRFKIANDSNAIEDKLLAILAETRLPDHWYALSSNVQVPSLSKENAPHTKQDVDFGPTSDIYRNYFYGRYLGIEQSNWRSGWPSSWDSYSPAQYSPVFETAGKLKYLRTARRDGSLLIIIWFASAETKLRLKTKYADRLVFPKYIGSGLRTQVFALVIGPSLEEKKEIYERLRTIYFLPRKEAILKMAADMRENLSVPNRVITNDTLGELRIGDSVARFRNVMQKLYPVIYDSPPKGKYNIPTILSYPGEYESLAVAGEHPNGDKIERLYTGDPKFATKEGIMATMSLYDFATLLGGKYKTVEPPDAINTGKPSQYITTSIYPNLAFLFVLDSAGHPQSFEKSADPKHWQLHRIYVGLPK